MRERVGQVTIGFCFNTTLFGSKGARHRELIGAVLTTSVIPFQGGVSQPYPISPYSRRPKHYAFTLPL